MGGEHLAHWHATGEVRRGTGGAADCGGLAEVTTVPAQRLPVDETVILLTLSLHYY